MTVRLGLAGCGIWGKHILRDSLSLGCQVTVADPDPHRRREALALGASSSVRAIPDLIDVEGVIVATPIPLHATTVAEALALGVPVFVEKPLTDDPSSADALATTYGSRLFVMHKWRYHPGVVALADIVASGELGPLVGIETRRLGWQNNNEAPDVLWTLLPHDLTIAYAVLGHLPEPISAVITGTKNRPLGMHALLGPHPWVHCEVGVATPAQDRRVVVRCRDGDAALFGSYDEHISVWRHEEGVVGNLTDVESRAIDATQPLLAEVAAFVGHLGGGPPPVASAAEGARVVAVASALRGLASV